VSAWFGIHIPGQWGNIKLTIHDVDLSTVVEELGGDVPVDVGGVLRMKNNGMRATGHDWVNWQDRLKLGLGGVVG